MFGFSSQRLGQVQILAAIVFLFLIPTTVIIAQNATNSSNTSFENLSLEGNLIASLNISDIANQSQQEKPPENQTSETNTSSGDVVDEEPPSNQTLNETLNETINTTTLNETLPETNQTLNETLNETSLNQTPSDENVTSPQNETLNETLNETVEPPVIPPSNLPILAVSIQGPDRITRSENITFSAEITNEGNGTAIDVKGFWVLPYTKEMPEFSCGEMEPGKICTQEIEIQTDFATPAGLSDIRVEVSYHD